uniref:Uncharacterized protein n=1 Tax=Timema genevievae TaxID=629358 RepID=A0A7R9KBF3_TIMGE|nr:unnamed protein product [Timema genevievae]
MSVLFLCVLDMINMMRLDYVPHCAEWIHSPGDAISALALLEREKMLRGEQEMEGVMGQLPQQAGNIMSENTLLLD